MAFKKYKELGDVLTAFKVNYRQDDFIRLNPGTKMPKALKDEFDFTFKNLAFDASEAAIGEMIIFPLLREAWREYHEVLSLWSHKAIMFSKDLSGIPDYLIARQSPLGKIVLDKPFLAVVEAKKDDFEGGWAQCALEMLTMQKINDKPETPIFGVVTNGDNWEFAKLEGTIFTRRTFPFTLGDLDQLFAALQFLLSECVEASKRY